MRKPPCVRSGGSAGPNAGGPRPELGSRVQHHRPCAGGALPGRTTPSCRPRRCCPPQEIDELFKIFRVLGTPDDRSWPGVSQYPDWKDTFPKWQPRNLAELVPTLEPAGVDVLSLMLRCAAFQPPMKGARLRWWPVRLAGHMPSAAACAGLLAGSAACAESIVG